MEIDKIEENAKNEVDKHIRVVKEKIKKFLSKDKPSDVLIIKTHLICEYYINQILIVKDLCNSSQLNNFSFFDKINRSFDIKDAEQKKLHDKMIGINKIRNKVGHELEYVLSESDVDTLGYITGKDYVLEKYDHIEIEELLRDVLLKIVIDLSMYLYQIIFVEKTKKNV